jgi:hypothetical protein
MTTFGWALAIAAMIWGGSLFALVSVAFAETFHERRRKGNVREPDLIHPSAGRFSQVLAAKHWNEDTAA